MKRSSYIILFLAFVTLAACEAMNRVADDINQELGITVEARKQRNDSSAPFVANKCPKVEAVQELTALYQYPDFTAPAEEDLISMVNITQLESSCELNDKSVTVDLKMAFEAELGPQATLTENDRPLFAYPFFVAITGPRGKIFAKEVFAASITFNRGENAHTYYEHLRQIIPIRKPSEAARYNVKVGFQLSDEQLAFNRRLIQPPAPAPMPATVPIEYGQPAAEAPEPEQVQTIKIVRPERPKRWKEEVVVPYGLNEIETAPGANTTEQPALAPPKTVIVPSY